MTTKLSVVEIEGPAIPRPRNVRDAKDWRHDPFWILTASVTEHFPHDKKDNSHLQEARIHPFRTLLLDPRGTIRDPNRPLPRLISMHVIAGDLDAYKENREQEALSVKLAMRQDEDKDFGRVVTRASIRRIANQPNEVPRFPIFHTTDADKPELPGFQHIVVEPILDGSSVWPFDKDGAIRAPRFRLVEGGIDLLGLAKEIQNDRGSFKWLGDFIKPADEKKDGKLARRIRLTPDGIEIEAEKVPFPGRPKLDGRFLLMPDADGPRLRLLAERMEDRGEKWLAAWRGVMPPTDDESRAVAGVKVEGRFGAMPPAFVFRTKHDDGRRIETLEPGVEIAPAELDVRLLSPRGQRGVDGEVTFEPEVYRLAEFKDTAVPDALKALAAKWQTGDKAGVVLAAEMRGSSDATPSDLSRLEIDGTPKVEKTAETEEKPASMKVALVSTKANKPVAHRLAHDERVLAATLRTAYGFDDLRAGAIDAARPLLSAFVALDDGWLQLPVPNFPPPDLTKDTSIVPDPAATANVLSGYLRFAKAGDLPEILSAFSDKPLEVTEAPWVVTVEGAREAALMVGIQPADKGATLLRAAVALDQPELSTRGLVWVSGDRPDVFESLPRIGAGPGVFLDIPLETHDTEKRAVVQFRLTELAIEATRGTGLDAVTRDGLAVSIAFDVDPATGWPSLAEAGSAALIAAHKVLSKTDKPLPLPPVRWQRHPRMPLAAEMPMTRGAAASVRPLESRDFVPFVVDTPAIDAERRGLASLRWKKEDVFPEVFAHDGKRLLTRALAGWPWPKPLPEGVAFAAFGVPGAEVAFHDHESVRDDPWLDLDFALRYDIPALDEAFATAELPPPPAEKTKPDERQLPPADPVPLAHDWPVMQQFWQNQNRRHQVARVQHSYLAAFRPLGVQGNQEVKDLVGGLTWLTKYGFEAATPDALPYGAATVGESMRGNRALLGVSAKFDLAADKHIAAKDAGAIDIVGYAPASFEEKVGQETFLMDSRRTGTQAARESGDVLWRAISIQEPAPPLDATRAIAGLATLTKPLAVENGAADFGFWFKDLPLMVDKTARTARFEATDTGVDFSAWQDGRLPRSGFEWRFVSTFGDAQKIFERGRHRIPFFGFALVPLRLTQCVLTTTAAGVPNGVKYATIEARLHLGPVATHASEDANRVTIELGNDGGGLKVKKLTAAGPLSFVLRDGRAEATAGSAQSAARSARPIRVVIGAKCALNTLKPIDPTADLTVTLLENDYVLPNAKVELPADPVGTVTITWTEPNDTNTVMPGEGRFVIREVKVAAKVDGAGETKDSDVAVAVTTAVLLAPKSAKPVVAEGVKVVPPLAIEMKNDDVTAVRFLGISIANTAIKFEPLDGAFAAVVPDLELSSGELLPGFPALGKLSFGFVARVASAFIVENDIRRDGQIALTAGCLDGEIFGPKPDDQKRVSVRRVTFRAECAVRQTGGPSWTGAIRFYGRLIVPNMIAWPSSMPKHDVKDKQIPLRSESGLTNITIDPGATLLHKAVYTLDGHAMAFETAARILVEDRDGVWAIPVVAKHTLEKSSDGALVAEFTAVETITIGHAVAIVPKDRYQLTIAPRYRDTIKNGKPSGTPAPGMHFAGIGELTTVLRGALGLPFQAAFWAQQTKPDGPFLAGGFVGLLVDSTPGSRDQAAPLLRLPVLAPLTGAIEENHGTVAQNTSGDIAVAWADGFAARPILATLRHAVAPASTSDEALRSALLAGSRLVARSGLTPDATVTAVLVEQSFESGSDALQQGDLTKTPFFLASAVSLSRNLERLGVKPAPVVLSLLAGFGVATATSFRSLASAVVTRNLPEESDDDEKTTARILKEGAQLATVGDDVVFRPWSGPSAVSGEAMPVAMIAGPAFADHVQPRGALVRAAAEGRWKYAAPPLPRHHERIPFRAAVEETKRMFHDAGRGYALLPETPAKHWLPSPEEGRMQPFRDADPTAKEPITASGVAGLSRIMGLPAHAAPVSDDTNAVRDRMVWLAQTRVPIYLPLELDEVKAPPVPWLSPGTPQSRLPVHAAVCDAYAKLDFSVSADDRVAGMQPILPPLAAVASVGDRAGISIGRIGRLETPLGAARAFDGNHRRFGRPAQGGSWSVRTERTPRPGALPENVGMPERDRRVCGSVLLVKAANQALIGPADTVAGEPNEEAKLGAWTVTFAAGAAWDGMIIESWDGTIAIDAEIDVGRLEDVDSPGGVVETLLRTVFGPVVDGRLKTRASLVIGDAVIPFVRLHVVHKDDAFAFVDHAGDPAENPSDELVHRAHVRLVLDARPADASTTTSTALSAIAQALSGNVLPPVEIRLVVHPESRKDPVAAPAVALLALDDGVLPVGNERAPVTLRLPLAPVVRSRGALPLVPTSILFTDPAYNASLSSAPFEERKSISAPGLPGDRGALNVTLYGDRRRINRRSAVTFMVDLSFEKKFDRFEKLLAERDGDILSSSGHFDLALELVEKRSGKRRRLFFGSPKAKAQPEIELEQVYEMPLASLVESDGSPAILEPGDMLEVTVSEGKVGDVKATVVVQPRATVNINQLHDEPVTLTLRITLTDEPVVEPPPALYAALVRRSDDVEYEGENPKAARLSLPLYAQSPLPWRVDLRDAKRGFREGLMRRYATFIWTLARPRNERNRTGTHVVKTDRNGQTWLPPLPEGNDAVRKLGSLFRHARLLRNWT